MRDFFFLFYFKTFLNSVLTVKHRRGDQASETYYTIYNTYNITILYYILLTRAILTFCLYNRVIISPVGARKTPHIIYIYILYYYSETLFDFVISSRHFRCVK